MIVPKFTNIAMNHIKFNTISSTNDFLKSYSKEKKLPNFFYVQTDSQTQGRGQRTNNWESACCENILISFLTFPDFSAQKQYLLNHIVSIALVNVLRKFKIFNVKIKQPNDIMAENKKIAGILIENVIHNQIIKQSIIGIGLNVNQTMFINLPQAISMKNITGFTYSLDEIVQVLRQELIDLFNKNESTIKELYEQIESYEV